MIQIDRISVTVPTLLSSAGKGPAATQLLIDAFNRQAEMNFDSKVYGHSSVKSLLQLVHRRKCCFCEKQLTDEQADVEHFRPKAGYVSQESTTIIKPGYYWLAYAFDNLLLSCTFCNRSHKKNHFPLMDEATRAKTPAHDLSLEDNLLLDPTRDRIAEHITFLSEVAKPINNSIKGATTIRILGLNRATLLTSRFAVLNVLRTLEKAIRNNDKIAEEARILIRESGLPSAPYSAMVRANFPDLV